MTQSSHTILLADDADVSRLIVEQGLRQAGYNVVSVKNGVEALATVVAQQVDLAILDVMMPEMDGFATLRELRSRYTLTQLPVIMLTALSEANSVIEALRAGANDYAVKPVDLSVLLGRVDTHLKLKSPLHRRVGPYAIEEQLGSGAMGLVFRATDTTGQRVAIKILPRAMTVQLDAVQRFLREADLLSRIEHPNVVRFYGAGHDGETHYMVMELVDGPTLEELAAAGPLPIPAALEISRQVGLGLRKLATHGILHRDIKPANLIVSRESLRVKIADFGVARQTGGDGLQSQTGTVVGSFIFSSTEQLDGKEVTQSDIYSMGLHV